MPTKKTPGSKTAEPKATKSTRAGKKTLGTATQPVVKRATSSASAERLPPASKERLEVGAALPAFELADQTGAKQTHKSFSGKPLLLYFYPKDDTPGCTREACGFRDALGTLGESGIRVVGVSPDSAARHEKFAEKYELLFTLLADETRSLAVACGVWVEKTNYGKTSLGVERSTFLFDKSGKLRRAWRKVKVDGHVDAILEALSDLKL